MQTIMQQPVVFIKWCKSLMFLNENDEKRKNLNAKCDEKIQPFLKIWATQSGVGFKNENMMNFGEIWMQTINHNIKI